VAKFITRRFEIKRSTDTSEPFDDVVQQGYSTLVPYNGDFHETRRCAGCIQWEARPAATIIALPDDECTPRKVWASSTETLRRDSHLDSQEGPILLGKSIA